MKIIEGMKVRAVCNQIGIDRRTAELYVHIHLTTNEGRDGIEVFDLPSNDLDVVLDTCRKIGKLKHQQTIMEDLMRVYADPEFREEMFKSYQNDILLRIGRYTLWDVVKTAIS